MARGQVNLHLLGLETALQALAAEHLGLVGNHLQDLVCRRLRIHIDLGLPAEIGQLVVPQPAEAQNGTDHEDDQGQEDVSRFLHKEGQSYLFCRKKTNLAQNRQT